MNPLVSVIVPIKDRKKYLIQVIDFLKNQTFKNFECLIIDDGSVDELEKEDCLNEKFIRFHRQDLNQGVSFTRNLGMKMARGNWICFLDSDDLWNFDKLEKQMLFHEKNNDTLVSQTNEKWIWKENYKPIPKKWKKKSGYLYNDSLTKLMITPSSLMFHRSILSKVGFFNEKLRVCEDFDWSLRLSLHCKIGLIEEELITKVGGHEDQLSFSKKAMDRFRIYSLLSLFYQSDLILSDMELSSLRNAIQVLFNQFLQGWQKHHPEESFPITGRDIFELNLGHFEFLLDDRHF
jgi:glycosyltransferase involved in cell wall biosynthesis